MLRAVAIAIFVVVIAASSAEAQICRGNVPIQEGRGAVAGGRFDFSGDSIGLVGTLGGGGAAGFALVDVGTTIADVEGFSESSFLLGVTGGAQLTGSQGRVSVCPTFFVTNEWVSDIAGTGANLWVLDAGGGASVGFLVGRSRMLKLIPAFGVFASRVRVRVSAQGESAAVSDTLITLAAGAGLLMHDKVNITPTVIVQQAISGGSGVGFRVTFLASLPGW